VGPKPHVGRGAHRVEHVVIARETDRVGEGKRLPVGHTFLELRTLQLGLVPHWDAGDHTIKLVIGSKFLPYKYYGATGNVPTYGTWTLISARL
jgi:hypothetical protein